MGTQGVTILLYVMVFIVLLLAIYQLGIMTKNHINRKKSRIRNSRLYFSDIKVTHNSECECLRHKWYMTAQLYENFKAFITFAPASLKMLKDVHRIISHINNDVGVISSSSRTHELLGSLSMVLDTAIAQDREMFLASNKITMTPEGFKPICIPEADIKVYCEVVSTYEAIVNMLSQSYLQVRLKLTHSPETEQRYNIMLGKLIYILFISVRVYSKGLSDSIYTDK